MSNSNRNSYEGSDVADLISVIAEFPEGDDTGKSIPVKKLSEAFDNCAKVEGGMKVYLRIRPMPSKGCNESTITVESDHTIVTNAPESSKRAQYTKQEERKYAFTRVFSPSSQQTDIYAHTMLPLLDQFFHGENCVLFTYGMTNSGKTYTVQGTGSNPGLLPRLVKEILETMQQGDSDDWDLQVSMLEIYQEKIFDLLGKRKDKLLIRDGNGRVEVVKLSLHPITSAAGAIKLMDSAAAKRSKSTTLLNAGSSRSHAVYTLTLNRSEGKSVIFQVVDLAGAERSNRTKATIQQQKEANNINVSLMQLWRCLQGMKKKNTEGSIPFRESKLTHLLMPQLCRAGLTGVAMIACVNPQVDDYDETLSILGNASLASKIKDMADLRRHGGGVTASSSAHIQQAVIIDEQKELKESKLAAAAAGAITAAAALGKRRRAEHSATGAPPLPMIEKRASKRTSAITHSAPSSSSAISAIEVTKPQASHRGSNYNATKIAFENVAEEEELDVDDVDDDELESASCVKRMRVEICRLIEDNHNLLSDQYTRESEIRNEVSLEMATRSAQLLDQLQDLQSQLDGKQYEVIDIRRSCKKVRRKQLDEANDNIAQDLQEAEEELERVKVAYEVEINELKEDKRLLEEELALFKEKYNELHSVEICETAATIHSLPSSQIRVRVSSSSSSDSTSASSTIAHAPAVEILEPDVFPAPIATSPRAAYSPSVSSPSIVLPKSKSFNAMRVNASTSSAIHDENENSEMRIRKNSAADEFSQRMQRDQRFKKIDGEPLGPAARPFVRSPLAPVKDDSNSPSKIPVPWEKSLRETNRPDSPLRFDTSIDKRSVSPLARRGKTVEQAPPLQVQPPPVSHSAAAIKNTSSKNTLRFAVPDPITCEDDIDQGSNPAPSPSPKARATVVSARRVISTRITNQAPDILAAYEAANRGQNANPNAGEYVSRLRTRTVR